MYLNFPKFLRELLSIHTKTNVYKVLILCYKILILFALFGFLIMNGVPKYEAHYVVSNKIHFSCKLRFSIFTKKIIHLCGCMGFYLGYLCIPTYIILF